MRSSVAVAIRVGQTAVAAVKAIYCCRAAPRKRDEAEAEQRSPTPLHYPLLQNKRSILDRPFGVRIPLSLLVSGSPLVWYYDADRGQHVRRPARRHSVIRSAPKGAARVIK